MVHFELRCPAASPLGHVPKVRPVWSGLAMCLDISVEPCQNPSVCVGSLWHGFHDAVRSHLRAASLFSGPPRCVAPRIAAQAKSRVRTRRSVVPVEIVGGLSEVAGQPLALRVARRDQRVWAAQAGQLRESSFVLKGRFCAGWTNQAIEIIACWHISRAHHQAASAGRFADSIANAVPTRFPHRATARRPSPDPGLRQPNPLGIYWHGRRCFAEEATMRTIVPLLLALVGMSLISTDADAGAGCATYRRGVSNCGYSSFEQCWATVLGLGGFCRPNPFPGTAYGTGAGSWNTPGSPRRYRRSY